MTKKMDPKPPTEKAMQEAEAESVRLFVDAGLRRMETSQNANRFYIQGCADGSWTMMIGGSGIYSLQAAENEHVEVTPYADVVGVFRVDSEWLKNLSATIDGLLAEIDRSEVH